MGKDAGAQTNHAIEIIDRYDVPFLLHALRILKSVDPDPIEKSLASVGPLNPEDIESVDRILGCVIACLHKQVGIPEHIDSYKGKSALATALDAVGKYSMKRRIKGSGGGV